jgi:hypothetical protein
VDRTPEFRWIFDEAAHEPLACLMPIHHLRMGGAVKRLSLAVRTSSGTFAIPESS